MRHTYECEIFEDSEGGYLVRLFDFDQMTQGDTFSDAVDMAADLIRFMVEDYLVRGRKLPHAAFEHKAKNGGRIVAVSVEVSLRASEEFVTATEAAAHLGVTRPRITHLLTSKKIIGYKEKGNTFISVASLKDYQNEPRKRGRPKEVVA
jgi:predicted RNase H-like HicB family nuclease